MKKRRATRHRVMVCLLLAGVLLGTTIALAVDIGDPAPDFTLPSTTGQPISLSQFKGKKHVLLQFYTLDFNPV